MANLLIIFSLLFFESASFIPIGFKALNIKVSISKREEITFLSIKFKNLGLTLPPKNVITPELKALNHNLKLKNKGLLLFAGLNTSLVLIFSIDS